ncbi:hypothetical protein BKA69DRAFT_1176267 [Paraphysoderma sedebokerense]|nr:hypothetical protein BKA69DRAFT_1176267 [Paraphysoderma sedebokerense]
MKSIIVLFALVAATLSSPIAQQSNSLFIGGNSGKNQFTTGNQVFESFVTLNSSAAQGTALVQVDNAAKNTQKGSSKISNNDANIQLNFVESRKNSVTTATTKADITNNLGVKDQRNLVDVNKNRATKQVLGSAISGNVAGEQENKIRNQKNAAKGDQTFDINLNKNIVFTGKQGKQVNSGEVSGNTADGNQKVNSDLTGNEITAKDCSSAKTPQQVLACLGL